MRSNVALRAVMGLTVVGAVLVAVSPVSAQTDTPLAVAAVVADNCIISTVGINFGSYDPIGGTPAVANGSVTITCTKDATATISLDLGAFAVGSVRNMDAGGSDLLEYELFTDAGFAAPWTAAAVDPGPAPSTDPRTIIVYGRVPAAQNVSAGSYNDSVEATVNF